MHKYVITANIDAALCLGVLDDFQYAPMDIRYENSVSIFERAGDNPLSGVSRELFMI